MTATHSKKKSIDIDTQFCMHNFLYNYLSYEMNSCFLIAKKYLDLKLLVKFIL